MKYYGTKNNKDYGFYEEPFENSIEIADAYWLTLLADQNEGKIIIPYDNYVYAVDPKNYALQDGVWKMLTEDEAKAKQLTIDNALRAEEIKNELEELDAKRIRAIAEPSLKDENTTWLEYYNSKASQLREELAQIS